jgi:hypothetical protein
MSSELWADNPEIQKRYNEIIANIRRLQAEFGIEPRTLEQRRHDYLIKKAEEQKRKEELAKINSIPRPRLGIRRP